MRTAKHRLQPAGQRLVRQHRIEIHRYLRHVNALTIGRDGRMQISQRFLVIDPSKFGHKALDKPKHAVGTVDESTLHLPSIRVLPAIASLVEKPFRARKGFSTRDAIAGKTRMLGKCNVDSSTVPTACLGLSRALCPNSNGSMTR